MFVISVETRTASVEQKEIITSGSVGIQVHFDFNADWNGLMKTAVFREGDDGTKIDVILDNTGECVIPHEVLKDEGEVLFIGVYGTNDAGSIVIPTVWATGGVVKPGTAPNTAPTAAPTPDIWAQILSVANEAEEAAGDALSVAERAEQIATEAYEQTAGDKAAAEAAAEAAQIAQGRAETAQENSESQALKSEGYAVGTQNGSDVSSGSPYYQNNAKYMKEQAALSATGASGSAVTAEKWATGASGGTPVSSGEPQYNNNAKYYSDQASESETNAEAAMVAAQGAQEAIENMTASVVGLPAGSDPTVTKSTIHDVVNLEFGIPQGAKGEKGDKGDQGIKGDTGEKGDTGAVPAFRIGTVQTGAPGTDASATITGPVTAPTLNLKIPRGAVGDTGPQGPQGEQGEQGEPGMNGVAVATEGAYAFNIEDGHLVLYYTGETAPDFEINDNGHLILNLS